MINRSLGLDKVLRLSALLPFQETVLYPLFFRDYSGFPPRHSVTIDASSVDSRVQRRDDDLRSDHFFDVAKYPTITFKSKKA
jgi:hypothetical protein